VERRARIVIPPLGGDRRTQEGEGEGRGRGGGDRGGEKKKKQGGKTGGAGKSEKRERGEQLQTR
jgi:hypothetical protein